jgi:hypothetical protein
MSSARSERAPTIIGVISTAAARRRAHAVGADRPAEAALAIEKRAAAKR